MQIRAEDLKNMNLEELYNIIKEEEFKILEDIEIIEVCNVPFLFFFKLKKRYPRFEFRSKLFSVNVSEDPVILRNVECLDSKAYVIQDEIKKLIKLKEEKNIPEDVMKEKILHFLSKYNYAEE